VLRSSITNHSPSRAGAYRALTLLDGLLHTLGEGIGSRCVSVIKTFLLRSLDLVSATEQEEEPASSNPSPKPSFNAARPAPRPDLLQGRGVSFHA